MCGMREPMDRREMLRRTTTGLGAGLAASLLSSCRTAPSGAAGLGSTGTARAGGTVGPGPAVPEGATRDASWPLGPLPALPDPPPAPGPTDFAARRERARETMADSSIDALFLTPGTNLLYFTGVPWGLSERLLACILPRGGQGTGAHAGEDGAPVWVCPAFEEARARESLPPGARVVAWEEHEDPFRRAAEILGEQGILAGRIGIDPSCPSRFLQRLAAAAPAASLVDGLPVTAALRSRKDAVELACMRHACAITRAAIAAALHGIGEGATAGEVSQRLAEAQTRLGGRAPWALVLFGPAAAFPHGTRERRPLREGDGVLADVGCQVHGYCSDLTRTVFLGRPSGEARRAWDLVHRAQETARRAIHPGATAGSIDTAAREVITRGGYGPGYRTFTHRLGHGIGLDGHEEHYLVQGNPVRLRPGMTHSDEPGIYVPGKFGIRLEDVVAVTEDGAVFLEPPLDAPELRAL